MSAIDIREALKNFIGDSLKEMHTCIPAKVVSFNGASYTATVQPLYNADYDGVISPMSQIVSAPVLKWKLKLSGGSITINGGQSEPFTADNVVIEQKLEPGDIVLVAISERSIDDIGSGEVHTPTSSRVRDLTDGIIVGVIGGI